jgi:DNA mismatch repair protein MutS
MMATCHTPSEARWQTLCTWHVPNAILKEEGQPQLTPMIRQFLQVKQCALGQMLFYRMGDFYEAFFEDALVLSGVLEITLTSRDAGVLGKIPMAGIPVKAFELHVPRLLEAGFEVAVCEQVEPSQQGKGLVQRRIIRTLSPGTVLEDAWLSDHQAQLLVALYTQGTQAGIAYCDLTTGTLTALELPVKDILVELERLQPKEILILGVQKKMHWHLGPSGGVKDWVPQWPQAWLEDADMVSQLETLATHYPWRAKASVFFEPSHYTPYLKRWLQVATLEGVTDGTRYPLATHALGALAVYVHQMFPEGAPAMAQVTMEERTQYVYLNRSARHHLELFKTARQERQEHSMYHHLNHTLTPMGARLLKHWLSSPLRCKASLEARQRVVQHFMTSLTPHGGLLHLRKPLASIRDMTRLVRKLQHGQLSPKDMLMLAYSLEGIEGLHRFLCTALPEGEHETLLTPLYRLSPELLALQHSLLHHLTDNPPSSVKDIGLNQPLIRPNIDPTIDELRDLLTNHEAWLSAYEQSQRELTGIKTLKVSTHQVFGYFIEVTRSALQQFTQQGHTLPEGYHRKQTLASVERYSTPTLKAFEARRLEAAEALVTQETACFHALWDALLPHVETILALADTVAALDVLQGFAFLAQERQYTRPILEEQPFLQLEGMRHPTLETLLPMGKFVANDCLCAARVCHSMPLAEGMTTMPPQLLMITGPNMAGKSTYMRQVALVVLMAHIGSFVPASYARIGLVDAIYTRIGASDDLSLGQSTFMVEMTEVADILNHATSQSLVLLDEVGRGTSTYDGMAIAWSIGEYLLESIGARTLFATHYHELNAMEQGYPELVQNLRVRVSEQEGVLTFLYRIEPGAAQKSYGLQVARMAGVPKVVIQQADKRLSALMKRSVPLMTSQQKLLMQPETLTPEGAVQTSLF